MVNKIVHDYCIPLLFWCHHKIVTKLDGNQIFFGMMYVQYDNGEVWAHVEPTASVGDMYNPQGSGRSVKYQRF